MDKVQFKGTVVEIARLVQGVRDMLRDLNHKMHELSGGVPIKCTIPADHADDMSCMARGKSWLQGCYTEPREQALMHAMVQQGTWRLSEIDEEGGLTWNRTACHEMMGRIAEISDLIMCLVHSAGPAVRGEELVRDQITNGIQPRTVYLIFGRLVLVRRHSKDTNARGMDPFNIRYLPQDLSEGICYFLLVIRPLERLIAQQLDSRNGITAQEHDRYLYMREGKRVTSSQFSSSILKRLTAKYFGVGLTVNPHRHIMIAFQREYVEEPKVTRTNQIGDILCSHGTQTARKVYARDESLPEGYDVGEILDIRDFCDEFQDIIGFGKRTVPLIPLRMKRKLGQRMNSMTYMTDHSEIASTTTAIVKEFGETVVRAMIAELKPYLSAEVKEGIGEALEYLALAGQSHPSTSPQVARNEARRHPEPPNDTRLRQPPSPEPLTSGPLGPQNQPLPGPVQQPPQSKSTGHRRVLKRELSQKHESVSKRRVTVVSAGVTGYVPSERPGPVNPATDTDLDEEFKDLGGFGVGDTVDDYGLESEPERRATVVSAGVTGYAPSERPGLTNPVADATPDEDPEALEALELRGVFDDYGSESESAATSGLQGAIRESVTILPPPLQEDAMQTEDEISGLERLSAMNLGPQDNRKTHSLAPSILSALQTLLALDNANFKSSEQRRLVECVMARGHTLAVLPTGGGKSMAYEIPAYCMGQLVIAVFPFKILVSQALRKCGQHGLAVQQWTSSDKRLDIEKTQLVVMAIETLLCEPMRK